MKIKVLFLYVYQLRSFDQHFLRSLNMHTLWYEDLYEVLCIIC